MIIDTTNDELLINGQRWQRGGYLLATAYATDQINITARDGRVIGKAIEWDRILDKDKNTFGLDRDGTVTALTNIFNSQVKSPYKIDALRDVENGTAAYGEIMIYRSPGEWQYEVLEQYHGAYDSEAATLRSGATATLELYYTAQADGDGISELSQSNTPASGYQIIRKLYYAERAQQDPDTGTWVQFADLAANTSFNDAKTALLAYLKERTGGTVPISLKMTWEETEVFDGLLDTYGGAAAAYSVRRLSSAYTGPLIEVERATDSTTQDIGYDANGDLDTTALATFCSGTTCTVRTWYDQSSNGNDAVQTTTSNQPKIYDSSTGVITENGIPAILSNGTTTKLANFSVSLTGDYFISLVSKLNTAGSNMWLGTTTTQGYFRALDTGTSVTIRHNGETGGADFTVSVGTTQLLHTAQRVSTTMHYAQNGVDNTTTERATQGATFDITCLFDGYNNQYEIDGTMQEVVIYASDQSSNRSGIETNINDYFGIYTPFTTGLLDDYGGAAAAYSLRRLSSTYTGPLIRVRRASDNAEQDINFDIEGNLNTGALAAFCSGTDGFVKTWYCQSGNGNDATQTTTANQPKIYDSSTGVVTNSNGNVAVYSDNSSTYQQMNSTVSGIGTTFTHFAVIEPSSIQAGRDAVYRVNSAIDLYANGRIYELNGVADTVVSPAFTTGNVYVHALDRKSSEVIMYGNGSQIGQESATAPANTYSSIRLLSSANNTGSTFNGYVTELVFYGSSQTSNRTGIETEINDFYSIYP